MTLQMFRQPPPRVRPTGSVRQWLGAAIVLAGALTGALTASPVAAQSTEKPQYGGTLSVGTIYVTIAPLTWDLGDWQWKTADDTGHIYDRPLAADFSKARRNGGRHGFRDNNWLPLDAVRGELAESWRWLENPLRLEMKLRKGIMFPERKGVMASRELVADDVLHTHEYLRKSPKAVATYWGDFLVKVEAPERHTVVYTFREFHAEWDMRAGYGHYTGVIPREVVTAGAANWRNQNGTGPFMITEFIAGNSVSYTRNPVFWDKERIGGVDYKLPFADKLVVRTIRDEAAQHAALRTGKLDILEKIRWVAVDELKKSAPALRWESWIDGEGTYLAMRTDTKPFDDIRVRRAMNIAVNKQELIRTFYGGNAELFAYPMHPDWHGYYEPLSTMPDAVKELFTYDVDKAKRLLAEAGYPNGFSFKVQVCSCSPSHVELLEMLSGYYQKIGVKIQIQPMEYGAFFSSMMTKTHAPGYLQNNAHGSPTITLTKLFRSNSNWNVSITKDAELDKRMLAMYAERSETKRQQMLKEMNRDLLAQAPYVWLPTSKVYTAWWPWVKNYGGELRGGGGRPGPVYSRIWIDQELKKKMGFN